MLSDLGGALQLLALLRITIIVVFRVIVGCRRVVRKLDSVLSFAARRMSLTGIRSRRFAQWFCLRQAKHFPLASLSLHMKRGCLSTPRVYIWHNVNSFAFRGQEYSIFHSYKDKLLFSRHHRHNGFCPPYCRYKQVTVLLNSPACLQTTWTKRTRKGKASKSLFS